MNLFCVAPVSLHSNSPVPMNQSNLTEDQRDCIRRRFDQIDSDKDGQITLNDLKNIHMDMAENPLLERTFRVMKGSSESLTLPALESAVERLSTPSEQDKLRFVFDIYDVDQDGFISPEDLFSSVKLMCRDNLSDLQLSQLVRRTFQEFDNDGKISFSDFERKCKFRLESQLNIEW